MKVDVLNKQVSGLEERAKLKGKIEGEIGKLKAEKASLEAYVAGLHNQKDELDGIKSEVNSLNKKKAELIDEITKLEKHGDFLADDIKSGKKRSATLRSWS